MRRLLAGVIALTFTVLFGGAAEGQIRMVAGPQRLVAQAPKFITAGFFNGDNFEDVAVTNSISTKITVLLGQSTGNSFGQTTDFDIGRTLRGLQAGDLNGDGIEDLAVTDFIDNKVFVTLGVGDGTFGTPSNYKTGLHPFDVTIGNFDGQKGNDLAVVDNGIQKASVFLNLGASKGFAARSDYQVGSRPKRIVAADLNGDGLDDIIAINTGTSAADDVSILLNNGVGGFNPPTNFVVGAGAVDVAVNDFNGDGIPDLAVLNAGIVTVQTKFTVSILINQTTTLPSGNKVGTGFFVGQTPVTVQCPSQLNGVAILCKPNYLASADFDNDGFNDLAITLFTQPQPGAGSTATSGLVQAFQGHGNGEFSFSNQVTVGNNPQGIVAGDFNGDGLSDVAIAEQGSISVRIINMLKPPPAGLGEPCHVPGQCASNSCVDGVCCGSLSCPADQFCDIPGSAGNCSLPSPVYNPCTDGHQCASTFCVDGFCCNAGVCPTGQFCNNPQGTCQLPAGNGNQCNSNNDSGGDNQCASGHCTDGVCCQDDRCAACSACNIPGSEGICTAELPIASSCTDDRQCAQPTPGTCDTTGFCQQGFCCNQECAAGESCALPGTEGFCAKAPSPTGTQPPTSTPTPTPTPQPNGGSCTVAAQCSSGHCVDSTCCSTATCPANEFCNISTSSPGVCSAQGTPGAGCSFDTDCASGNCDRASGSCQGTRTPTPTPTFAPGQQCDTDDQCTAVGAHHCTADGTGASYCCATATCPSGFTCAGTGICHALPTAPPTPRTVGDPCSTTSQCDQSIPLFCTENICCLEEDCTVTDPTFRCDIPGSEGQCSPPNNTGGPCTKNTDCIPLLACDPSTLTCQPPIATPTIVVPTFTPITGTFTTTTSSGGGCSIDTGSNGGVAWLLLALPLLFGVRRYRLQRVPDLRSASVRRDRSALRR